MNTANDLLERMLAAGGPAMTVRREGFIHKGLIVYALQYDLDEKPLASVIVWLDRSGNSLRPHTSPAEKNRPMVTPKPGDYIAHHGRPRKVVAVSVYRALGTTPGTEVVG